MKSFANNTMETENQATQHSGRPTQGLIGVTVNGEQEGSEGGRGRPQEGRGCQDVWGGCPSWSLAHCFWGAPRGVQHLEVGAAGVHLPTGHKVARAGPLHVPGETVFVGHALTLWDSELAPASTLGTKAPGCSAGRLRSSVSCPAQQLEPGGA